MSDTPLQTTMKILLSCLETEQKFDRMLRRHEMEIQDLKIMIERQQKEINELKAKKATKLSNRFQW